MKALRLQGLAECEHCGVTLSATSDLGAWAGAALLPLVVASSVWQQLLPVVIAVIPATAMGLWLKHRLTLYKLPSAPVPQLPVARVLVK